MSVEVFNLQAEEVGKQRKGDKEQPVFALHFSTSSSNTWVHNFQQIAILFCKLDLCSSLSLKSSGHSSKNIKYDHLTMQKWE